MPLRPPFSILVDDDTVDRMAVRLRPPFSILLVDDDTVDRMAVRRALKAGDLNYELAEVGDCATAAAALQQQAFDCVLLDYLLPDGNALSVISALRQHYKYLPVVVLTGQGDEQIAVEVMKAGASDYLAKNKISPARLSQSIKAAIRLYEAEVNVIQVNQLLRTTNERLKAKTRLLEQKQQQIHLKNLQLLQASRLKSEFLATMSHELRTPMNAIMGFSQILLQKTKGPLTDAQVNMLQRIFDNSRNLLGLLNRLLDFSKVEAGRTEICPAQINLAKLVLTTTEELRSLAEQKDLALEVDIQLEHKHITSDAERLRQILVNLLSNAIKFTDAGHVLMQLTEADEDRVAIAIHDTGVGIAADQQTQIFDAFCQVDQSTTRKHQGTGLGLAITKSLVDLLQGEIELESELGHGSVFRVILPRHLPALEAEASDEPLTSELTLSIL